MVVIKEKDYCKEGGQRRHFIEMMYWQKPGRHDFGNYLKI